MKYAVIAMVVYIALFWWAGGLIPLWVFVNSLMLLVHTCLINQNMPSLLFYMLADLLQLFRLPLYPALSDAELHEMGDSQGMFTENFKLAGYRYLLKENLEFFILFTYYVAIVKTCFAIKDVLGMCSASTRPFFTKRIEPYITNFNIRILLEIYFEIAICAFLYSSIEFPADEQQDGSPIRRLQANLRQEAMNSFNNA